jgi:hypothetical protein
MKTARNKELENKAMELGAAAYKAGKKLCAARDDEYMNFAQSDEVKAVYITLFSTASLAAAYNKGWLAEDLKNYQI